ncbi:MAG: hypothetical protein ACOYK9_01970 [Chlamydiia bacterium]
MSVQIFREVQYTVPNYADPYLDFKGVYEKLIKWGADVAPVILRDIIKIGATIEKVRLAREALQAKAAAANGKKLAPEVLEAAKKECETFKTLYKRFKGTRDHTAFFASEVQKGIKYLSHAGISRESQQTLHVLDPALEQAALKLIPVCEKALAELQTLYQEKALVNSDHFDKRVGDYSRALQDFIQVVETQGNPGYWAWGMQKLSNLVSNPTIPAPTLPMRSEDFTVDDDDMLSADPVAKASK